MTHATADHLRTLVAEGKTIAEIAQHVSLDASHVSRRIKALGIKAATPIAKPRIYRVAQRRTAKGGRQPTGRDTAESHNAINTIFALDDRLNRGDYFGEDEAQQIRQTIANLSKRVVV